MDLSSIITTDEAAICYHCGEDCDEAAVRIDDKPFCCEGCKSVYEILDQNGLSSYYCIEDQPGVSFQGLQRRNRFDYLEDESVVEELMDFRDGSAASVTLNIPGIHCTSCIWLLEHLYKLDNGITRSSVDFLRRELSLTFDHSKTSLRSIVELLCSIGYEPDLRLDSVDKKSREKPDRSLWLKLGVAGFAFGNIMLFSFPDYLAGTSDQLEGSFGIFFGILNIALGLPVLLYSAREYLKSAWAAVRQRGINLDVPISIGILALFGRSVYEIVTGIGTGYMDSFTGLVFFLLIGRMVQKKTFERLAFDRDYRSYLPLSVTILDSDEGERSIPVNRLREEDRILIHNQELIPADSVLLSDHCFIDYSFITGESEPVKKSTGDRIYAGGRVVGKSALMKAAKEVSSSYLTRLWNSPAFETAPLKTGIASLADRISPWFTTAVLGIATLAGLWWLPSGAEQGISVFTAVLIIACPCALALSTPFTLGSALNIFSKNGFYIKGVEVVENLSGITDVVFDKTGTLTRSEEADVTFHGQNLSDYECRIIKSVCKHSVHPASQKIVRHLEPFSLLPANRFEEQINRGLLGTIEGHQVLIGSALFLEEQADINTALQKSGKGAVAAVHVAIDKKWRGCFKMKSSYRTGIRELLFNLGTDYATYLISGDNDREKEVLETSFRKDALLFNRTPRQKLDFVKTLQSEGRRVLMIGDGLNDAGALRQSDFGVALTDKINSFTPASDAILEGNTISNLDRFIRFAQTSMKIILWSFGISLIYNIVGLGFAVTGQLSPLVAAIIMPLSSISIMLFTNVTTHLTADRMGLKTWK